LKTVPLNNRLFFVAHRPNGETLRMDAGGSSAPLSSDDLAFLAHAVDGRLLSAAPELLRHEDDFYFSHHREIAKLPVYRLIAPSGTRYYFDSVSGMLVAKQDSEAQAFRWLHEALHRMDFAAAIRSRPQWDVLMWLLMTGVTVVCVTGAYLGVRRLARNSQPRP
jgi:hypothetical protein